MIEKPRGSVEAGNFAKSENPNYLPRKGDGRVGGNAVGRRWPT